MISKTSLFDKGIYKSTLRRYIWGSVLYFILLFMTTGMMLFLEYSHEDSYIPTVNGRNISVILDGIYLQFPILMAIAVPTVVGLLIFRFMHSKKTAIFIHSLPVKRTANYISSVAAALTLMILPVLLNTGILMMICASGFARYYSYTDCLVWMILNIFTLFTMFSCVCFVSSLTGNSFAMIVLNILFHITVPIITASMGVFCEKFLFGYTNLEFLLNKVADNNFPIRIIDAVGSWEYSAGQISGGEYVKFILFSLVLYILGGVLYRIRAMEKAEDVAGFKCLNPIFKYLLTLMGAMAAFAVFNPYIEENEPAFWLIVALASAVVYFASEVVLKKSFKVWKSYKGFLSFAAVFCAMILVFSFTDFLGYETRIPKKDEIKNVALYDYYSENVPFVSSGEDITDRVINVHGKMIAKTERITKSNETAVHIEYELKNGKFIHRRYNISQDELFAIMNSMYKNEEFKKKTERIFVPYEIYMIEIYGDDTQEEIFDKEKTAQLTECIREDVLSLDYDEIHTNGYGFTLEISYVLPREENTVQDKGVVVEQTIGYKSMEINPNYKKTMEWLKENGYYEKLKPVNEGPLFICRDRDDLPLRRDETRGGRTWYDPDSEKEAAAIKIEKTEDIEKVLEYISTAHQRYLKNNEGLSIYSCNLKDEDFRMISRISKEEAQMLFPNVNFSGKFN